MNRLVGQEVNNGIRSDRIVIGGFSQGAAISLLTGLRSEHRLAGVVSYSGFLGMENKTREVSTRPDPRLVTHVHRRPRKPTGKHPSYWLTVPKISRFRIGWVKQPLASWNHCTIRSIWSPIPIRHTSWAMKKSSYLRVSWRKPFLSNKYPISFLYCIASEVDRMMLKWTGHQWGWYSKRLDYLMHSLVWDCVKGDGTDESWSPL